MNDSRLAYWTVVIYVLLTYAFYPAFKLTVSSEPLSLYQYLTQSLLSGHLYLNDPPSAELLNLADPYNPTLNEPFRLHDASLYKGKYYLYFGLLPILFFYLPFKVVTGFYPSAPLATFFFLSLAFLVSYFLMIKIKEKYFPFIAQWQLILAGLLLGFGNGITVLFSVPRVYEVAIASALCFTIFSFYFLYQIVNNQAKTKDVFLFSLCLSLTVAGRPHFAFVCLLLIPAVLIYLMALPPTSCGLTAGSSDPGWIRKRRIILLSALLIPALCVALLLAEYNYLRFGSFFDFGHFWQLSCNNIQNLYGELADLSKIPRNLWYSFYFYFLQPFTISPQFPFFGLRLHHCKYFIDKDYYLEAVAGVLLTTPWIVLIVALPKLLMVYFKEKKNKIALAWFILFAAFVPLVNLLFLLALPFAIQRYEVDFLPYLVILAIISFWMLEEYAGHSRWFKLIRIIYIATAIMSIVLGLCFTLIYWVFT
ncbi:MAG: hypothetical protein H0T84_11675 [Tatlockia sp.]|nr:hypothetical protein [Tatlockia sp.]